MNLLTLEVGEFVRIVGFVGLSREGGGTPKKQKQIRQSSVLPEGKTHGFGEHFWVRIHGVYTYIERERAELVSVNC